MSDNLKNALKAIDAILASETARQYFQQKQKLDTDLHYQQLLGIVNNCTDKITVDNAKIELIAMSREVRTLSKQIDKAINTVIDDY